MKFIHLSDLHIGKRLKETSLIDDQKYIFSKLLEIVDAEAPDFIIIAGDVYDKSVPSAEAVEVFDDFLYSLSQRGVQVFVISGNHDSPERIAFGSRLMDRSGIHLSPVYNGKIEGFGMKDEYGTVDIYMLPFVRPADVRRFFPEEEINSYTDAVRVALSNIQLNENNRNIIITHQFVTGAERCDSEDKSVGGTDNVDGSVFEKFDYTALGHIHGPQNVGSEKIRYCGTPLKYSFSEAAHKKSVTVVTMNGKGSNDIRTIPLFPMRDLRKIKGSFDDIKATNEKSDDYISVTLTDEEEIPDAIGKLRFNYPNILELLYDNRRTRGLYELSAAEDNAEKDPFTVFSEFYKERNGSPLSEEQAELIEKLIGEIWEVKE